MPDPAARAKFLEIARTRALDYCPSCQPEKTTASGMQTLLAQKVGRGFKCACGTSWVWKPNHGVLSSWQPSEVEADPANVEDGVRTAWYAVHLAPGFRGPGAERVHADGFRRGWQARS